MVASSAARLCGESSCDSDVDVDRLTSVLEPLVVLPSQFYSNRAEGVREPERNLMATLLIEGIEAYITESLSFALKKYRALISLGEVGVTGRLDEFLPRKSEICEWVDSLDDSYVFSFEIICSSLGIHPNYLRRGLHLYVKKLVVQSIQNQNLKWKKIRRPRTG